MHKAVQYDVAEEFGFGMEVFVVGPKGIGWLDLYDGETNQYYEVKHALAANGKHLDDQMNKYDSSHVSGWRFSEFSTIGGNVSKGQAYIVGKTAYLYWDITYYSKGDGIIIYKWTVNDERYAQYVACAAVACTAAMSGRTLEQGQGFSNPVKSIANSTRLVF